MNKGNFVIRFSKRKGLFLIPVNIIWLGMIITLTIFAVLEQDVRDLATSASLILFQLLLVYLCVKLIRRKIVVKRGTITYTPTFGKTKSYTFKDIKKVMTRDCNVFYPSKTYKVFNKDGLIFSFGNQDPGSRLLLQIFEERGIVLQKIDSTNGWDYDS
ncbi:MAG: hypothetical protein FWG40_10940 [Peptococcaceae bacterium]|nr:hypothetical protein [Peptococcaceae bacterium]